MTSADLFFAGFMSLFLVSSVTFVKSIDSAFFCYLFVSLMGTILLIVKYKHLLKTPGIWGKSNLFLAVESGLALYLTLFFASQLVPHLTKATAALPWVWILGAGLPAALAHPRLGLVGGRIKEEGLNLAMAWIMAGAGFLLRYTALGYALAAAACWLFLHARMRRAWFFLGSTSAWALTLMGGIFWSALIFLVSQIKYFGTFAPPFLTHLGSEAFAQSALDPDHKTATAVVTLVSAAGVAFFAGAKAFVRQVLASWRRGPGGQPPAGWRTFAPEPPRRQRGSGRGTVYHL